MRVEINHRRQIWDNLVRFRAIPKLLSVILACGNKSPAANLGQFGAISCDSKTAFGCQAALRARIPKYWIDQIIILDTLLVLPFIFLKLVIKRLEEIVISLHILYRNINVWTSQQKLIDFIHSLAISWVHVKITKSLNHAIIWFSCCKVIADKKCKIQTDNFCKNYNLMQVFKPSFNVSNI